MNILFLEACEKELASFPKDVIADFLDAISLLRRGVPLGSPLSKPMTSIGKGISEIRLRGRRGAYRVFYLIRKKDAIYIIHAFQKKTQKTPKKNIDLIKKRIRRLF